MKLKVIHGFFVFEETRVGQISDYMGLTGLELVPRGTYYTFKKLLDAPLYSLNSKPFLGFTALKTFEGANPWDVFEANGVIYDFTDDTVKPIESVTKKIPLAPAGNRFVSNGLILPGSLTDEGERVKDYAAWFSRDRLTWLYSEVDFV